MRLHSGKEVSDESLRQVVESAVLCYAGYGFEDYGCVIHDISGDLGNEVFDCPDLLGLSVSDIGAIIETVEPLVKEVCGALGDAYAKLSKGKIDSHVWQ